MINKKSYPDDINETGRMFKTIADQSPNMIFINVEGKVVYANQRCEELTGYKVEELTSPDFNFLSITAPEYRKPVLDKFNLHMTGKEVEPYEYAIITKSGKRLNTILSSRLIHYKGKRAVLGTITDITERKKAEETAWRIEQKYRLAYENSFNAILWADIETGTIIDCNQAAEKLFERPKNELTGIHFSELHPPEISNKINHDFKKAISDYKKRLPVNFDSKELSIIAKSGRIKNVLTSSSVIEIDGKLISQGIFLDITPQNQLMEELSDSEKKFRLAFENSQSAIMWVDVDNGIIIDCNSAAEYLFECTKKDLIGQHHTTLHPPELTNQMKKAFRDSVFRHSMGHYKNIHAKELPIITKKGKRKIALFSSSLSKLSGKTIIQGVIIDITERKQLEDHLAENEKKYRNLFELIQDAIAVFEVVRNNKGEIVDRIIRDANPAFVRTASAPDLESLKNKSLSELFGKDLADDTLPQVRRAMSTGTAQTIELRTESNGKYYDYDNVIIPISEDLFLSRTADVTAIREMDRKKDEFISVASHELKTPLTSLKLYSQILMAKKIGCDDYIIKMNEQIEKLSLLVNQLLDVSKVQSNKLELNKELFSLTDLVKSCIDNVQIITAGQKIIFKNNDSCTVFADKARIEQVLINLLTNASKYSPGDSKILVSLKKNKKAVVISVKDQGVGIGSDSISKVFDKFYRTGNNATQIPGLGMGLFISKNIINQHGGKIWVKSKLGVGTTFLFSLPLINE